MSKGKWICRYLFFALLLLLCLGFCGYCLFTVQTLEAQTRSLEFVDLALESMVKAQELVGRIENYRTLLTRGLIATGAVALALALLIGWHILSVKWAKRPPKEKKAAKAPEAPAAVSAPTDTVCPTCGKGVQPGTGFCGYCGSKMNGC